MENFVDQKLENLFLTVVLPYIQLEIFKLISTDSPIQWGYWLKISSAEERATKYLARAIEQINSKNLNEQWTETVKMYKEFNICTKILDQKFILFFNALLNKDPVYFKLFIRYIDI